MLEDITEPVMDAVIEENTVHPLVQAMRELRETGIIESVDTYYEETDTNYEPSKRR